MDRKSDDDPFANIVKPWEGVLYFIALRSVFQPDHHDIGDHDTSMMVVIKMIIDDDKTNVSGRWNS